MFKAIFLLQRRPGMTVEAFQDYYETTHSKFVRLLPGARHYERRYVTPLNSDMADGANGTPPDVVMELWFDDRAAFDAAFANVLNTGMRPVVVEDEEKLFDRAKIVGLTVTRECPTQLPGNDDDAAANKAFVVRYLNALGAMQRDAARELMHEDCQCILPTVSLKPNVYTRDGMLAFIDGVKQVIPDGIRFEYGPMTAEANRVSAIVNGFAKTIEGKDYNNCYHFLIEVKDGKVFRHHEYFDSFLGARVMGPLLARATGKG